MKEGTTIRIDNSWEDAGGNLFEDEHVKELTHEIT